MYEYEATLILAGTIIGVFVHYFYSRYRQWRYDEIIDLMDMLKDNPHIQNHIIDPLLKKIKSVGKDMFTGIEFENEAIYNEDEDE